MAYASLATIHRIYGPSWLENLLPHDLENPVATVEEALVQASSEMDGYLSARYPLPLTTYPAVLERPCIDIMAYVLANAHTRLTVTIEDRYKQAVALLQKIAEGKAGLGADEPALDTGGVPTLGGSSGADFSANPRRFGRRS